MLQVEIGCAFFRTPTARRTPAAQAWPPLPELQVNRGEKEPAMRDIVNSILSDIGLSDLNELHAIAEVEAPVLEFRVPLCRAPFTAPRAVDLEFVLDVLRQEEEDGLGCFPAKAGWAGEFAAVEEL